jgi:hypothetical protein
MKENTTIKVTKETHRKLKVGATRRGKQLKQHLKDLSELSLSIIDVKWKK